MALGLGDVIRLTTHIKNDNSGDIMNTWDLEIEGAGSGGDDGFKEDCIEWANNLFDPIAGFMSNRNNYYQLHFYQRNGLTALTPVDWTPGSAFSAADVELPFGTSLLVYAHTGVRRVLPRKYIGAFTEAANDDGVVNPAIVTAGVNMGDAWLAPFTGSNGWDLQAVCWPGTNTGSIPLQANGCSEQWAIQRRRRVGRGS